jgi:hypothetical protein
MAVCVLGLRASGLHQEALLFVFDKTNAEEKMN